MEFPLSAGILSLVRWKYRPARTSSTRVVCPLCHPTRAWSGTRVRAYADVQEGIRVMQELLATARSMFSPPAAVLPAGAAGSPQRPKTFSLMALGDSITDGGAKLRSYRFHLHQSLARSGYEVEWVGSMLGVQVDTR